MRISTSKDGTVETDNGKRAGIAIGETIARSLELLWLIMNKQIVSFIDRFAHAQGFLARVLWELSTMTYVRYGIFWCLGKLPQAL